MNPIMPERVLRLFLEQGLFHDQLTERLILVVWVMLAASAAIWILLGRRHRGYQYTAVYWLACGLGLWLCLYLPVPRVIPSAMLVLGAVSLLFAYLPIARHHRWRTRTWPAHPANLTCPFVPPSGLVTSITALSLVVFFLGLCYLTSANAARSCMAMGLALLILMQYDFRAESAMAGLVMITLAVVSAFLDLCRVAGQSSPTILALVLIPMSYLAFHWVWLGCRWARQILDGVPLTTSAKLVRLTRHVGVMLLGFATLLAVKLSLWPLMPAAAGHDDASGPLVPMILAYGLLLMSSFWIAWALEMTALAALAALNLFAAFMAIIVRQEVFFHSVFWPHWRQVTVIYIALVLAALLLVQRRWQKTAPSASGAR